ncbi:MAG: type II toxin-antitoxin system PemK/MazF family toxin [Microgenomates group bacterium]
MKYKQGEIYLVKFHPSLGKEIRKFRPAVIMFNNQVTGFVTVSPLTSILKINHKNIEYIIEPSPTNGLEKSSLLLSWYLRTIDDMAIQKPLGKLGKLDLQKLKTCLKNLI